MPKKLLVTHKAPDLDAIGAVWVLKRFDSQHYADAKVAFVDAGTKISARQADKLGVEMNLVTHVDTGLGKFDHHQPDRANQMICAASLTHEYVLALHPELEKDQALRELVNLITEVDHFQEIHWPEPTATRYNLMIPELLRGHELSARHDDDSQLHFGLQCLDHAYNSLKSKLKAQQLIEEQGENFQIKAGPCLGIKTNNDDTLKEAQKMGYVLVLRKDKDEGNILIKARPDSSIELKPLSDKIQSLDQTGTWFYHNGGKMLLNGCRSNKNQIASPLSLAKVIELIQDLYG
jgi:hypothetical protein